MLLEGKLRQGSGPEQDTKGLECIFITCDKLHIYNFQGGISSICCFSYHLSSYSIFKEKKNQCMSGKLY